MLRSVELASRSRSIIFRLCTSRAISSVQYVVKGNGDGAHRSFAQQNLRCSKAYSTNVRMPSLSPTMTEGKIVKWYKAEGEQLQPGDVLCEIQTDKAVVALEFEEEGVLAKVLRGSDSGSVQVGLPIAVVAEPDEDWRTVEVPTEAEQAPPAPPAAESQAPTPPPAPASSSPPSESRVLRYGPAARLLMQQYGLTANQMAPSGPFGTLLKSDVLQFVAKGNLPLAKKPQPQPQQQPQQQQPQQQQPPQPEPQPQARQAIARPRMERQEPRSAAYVDHAIDAAYAAWARQQLATKQSVPHAYATVCCRPCMSLLATAGVTVGAMATQALARALAESGVGGDVGVLTVGDGRLPTVTAVPRAAACGLLAIGRAFAAASDNEAAVGRLQAVVFDLSEQPVISANPMLTPSAPLLLTVGQLQYCLPQAGEDEAQPRDDKQQQQPPQQQQQERGCMLSLTYDSRYYDDAQACELLSAVRANMETPLFGFGAGLQLSQAEPAHAAGAQIIGSDLLQLGLDD